MFSLNWKFEFCGITQKYFIFVQCVALKWMMAELPYVTHNGTFLKKLAENVLQNREFKKLEVYSLTVQRA